MRRHRVADVVFRVTSCVKIRAENRVAPGGPSDTRQGSPPLGGELVVVVASRGSSFLEVTRLMAHGGRSLSADNGCADGRDLDPLAADLLHLETVSQRQQSAVQD